MSNRKRFYELTYEATGEPIWFEDAGHLLKIEGVKLGGMGTSFIALLPTAPLYTFIQEYGEHGLDCKCGSVRYVSPTLEEWCELIRNSDDPSIFELDNTGSVKAIHRKVKFAISGGVQWAIWERDEFTCMYCGRHGGKGCPLTVDHFVPLEHGGANNERNYLASCRQCNKLKGNRDPEGFCVTQGYDYEGLRLYLDGAAPRSFISHLQEW